MNNYEGYAIAVIIAFGALVIGGLMIGSLALGAQDGFLFALGAAGTAWLSGWAVLINRPNVFALVVAVTALLCAASVFAIVR